MAYISRSLREQVTQRARGLCEYCQTSQAIVVEMEIDHIVPLSTGGATTFENLCLACVSCNSYKRNHIVGIDPESGQEVPLFNPRTQLWGEHFIWQADATVIAGSTPTGRATVERLQMNRKIMIQARQKWVQSGWHPPATG